MMTGNCCLYFLAAVLWQHTGNLDHANRGRCSPQWLSLQPLYGPCKSPTSLKFLVHLSKRHIRSILLLQAIAACSPPFSFFPSRFSFLTCFFGVMLCSCAGRGAQRTAVLHQTLRKENQEPSLQYTRLASTGMR